jgi:hypothetical protein
MLTRTGDPTMPTAFELPDKTLRWLLHRSARALRLPLLGAVLPPAAGAGEEDGAAARQEQAEVFFVDAAGRETTAADAVRVEVVSDGPDGFPIPMAFTRLAHQRIEQQAEQQAA